MGLSEIQEPKVPRLASHRNEIFWGPLPPSSLPIQPVVACHASRFTYKNAVFWLDYLIPELGGMID